MNAAVAAAVATALGAVTGEWLGPGDGHRAACIAACIAVVAVRAPRSMRRAALVAIVSALLAGASMQRALDGLVRHTLPMATTAAFTGTLVGDPTHARFWTEARLRVERVDGVRHDDRVVAVRATGDATGALGVLASGDRVTLIGRLGPLTGYDERERWHHAVGTLRTDDLVAFAGPTDPLAVIANAARDVVFRGMAVLPPSERALLAGFLLGDRRALPSDVEDEFKAAGLTHLLAVSGANLAFVVAIARPALNRLGRRGRLSGGLTIVVVFGAMTRWEPSVLRAATMAAIAMVAVHLGRPQMALRVLALAVTVLVLADPFLVHSVGFALSVGASLGLVVLAAPIQRHLRGPTWLREGMAATIAAQLATAPIVLGIFGTIPLVAVPANVVAGAVAGPLTTWGLFASVVGGVITAAAPVLQLPTAWFVRAELATADIAARVPIALDARAVWALVALGAAGAAIVRRRRVRRVARIHVAPERS